MLGLVPVFLASTWLEGSHTGGLDKMCTAQALEKRRSDWQLTCGRIGELKGLLVPHLNSLALPWPMEVALS
jgi:hypothetical protein